MGKCQKYLKKCENIKAEKQLLNRKTTKTSKVLPMHLEQPVGPVLSTPCFEFLCSVINLKMKKNAKVFFKTAATNCNRSFFGL